MDLQVIKSYCKSESSIVKLLVWVCHPKEELDEVFSHSFFSNKDLFIFRNREFVVRDLLKWFLIEYVDGLVGGDKIYCDMDGIKGHITNLCN